MCYNPPQFFTSLPGPPKVAPSTAAPAPVAAPVAPPIPTQPTQPTASPQPYIKTRLPSPMQVDPANVPLPTPSTASRTTPHSAMSSPPSPRTQRIVQHMQQEAAALASGSVSPPRGRATAREGQELRNALHAMFGLPPIPIPQSRVDRSTSPMAAISNNQSRRDESRRSPPISSIPTIRCHSPEPEAGPSEASPSKRPITWDLKDPAHPLHRWGMQQAYKQHIEEAGYDYPVPRSPAAKSGSQPASPVSPQQTSPQQTSPQQTSPQQTTSPLSDSTGFHSPGLESIPEEEETDLEAAPPGGHHQPPTIPGGIHQEL